MRAHSFRLSRPARDVGIAPRPPISGLPIAVAERLGDIASAALLAELETWPKPGLVSHVDSGSHDDMDHTTFRRSAAAIRPFFARLAIAGAAGAEMERLRRIGRDAEEAMLAATGGVNTHRGAIFGLGLLCAAAGAASAEGAPARLSATQLTDIVAQCWGDDILRGPIPLRSNGSGVLRRFGAGGARAEAAAGFPQLREIGLPGLRRGRALAGDEDAARVQAFFALMAEVEDTNLLHRGGGAGLQDAQDAARRFLGDGGVGRGDWEARAVAIHHEFVRRRLSPGGCADLLAATIFLDAVERWL
ncbi:triphosphoribosyl-dephospho-CoA synthase MdcB [Inquilinus sp. YAF38]|uniref:triphosphoribosyl-dephospho-CoA synthase MdcB n=1 Tax=Inquilinus sp. YAF38 TaxID=3233084 RepID=UPI003F908F6F